ncbi:MAG: ATP-binding cassette domain-containing protein [Actinomycetota bacterium]
MFESNAGGRLLGGSNEIEVEGLVREFKGGIRAVDGVDLLVKPGEIYGFLGPNGAGKSTTVHVLTTLLPPTGGTARVAGFDVAAQGRGVREVIGAALQEVALDPHLSGREHMRLQASLHGLARPRAAARAAELLERVGLTDAADRKVATYSGGMKRRLDLALALVHSPSVLFLDEPTTGLDPQSRAALWDEVRHLARDEGVTVFLTTQYLEEADVLADRVGIIRRGRIVAEGTPDALKRETGRRRIEVVPADPSQRSQVERVLAAFGDPHEGRPEAVSITLDPTANGNGNGHGIERVVRALGEAGVAVEDLAVHAPSLDDVFLQKTGRTLEGAATGSDDGEGEAA